MHTSQRCKVYLHVTSAPVIEHSTALMFAPYPSTLAHQPVSRKGVSCCRKTDSQTGVSRLTELADFDWVRGGQSPNWRRMSEDEEKDGEDVVRQLEGGADVQSLLERLLPASDSSR